MRRSTSSARLQARLNPALQPSISADTCAPGTNRRRSRSVICPADRYVDGSPTTRSLLMTRSPQPGGTERPFPARVLLLLRSESGCLRSEPSPGGGGPVAGPVWGVPGRAVLAGQPAHADPSGGRWFGVVVGAMPRLGELRRGDHRGSAGARQCHCCGGVKPPSRGMPGLEWIRTRPASESAHRKRPGPTRPTMKEVV